MNPPKSTRPQFDERANLQALKQRLETAREQYEARRDSSEREVVRWVWTTAPRYHLDPLFFFDRETHAGNLVQRPPSDPRGHVAYGFSASERIVVARQYLTVLHDCYYKTFYSEEGDRILSYHFDYGPTNECINCAQLFFAGLAPACYQQWAVRGWASHTYVTVDGKIRSFVAVFQEDEADERRIAGKLQHRDDGRIEVWTRWPGMPKAERTFYGIPIENPFIGRSV